MESEAKGLEAVAVGNESDHSLSTGLQDELELAAVGKKQVLRRGFGFWSLLGVALSITITWEGFLVFVFGLQNGGPTGLFFGYIFSWLGYFCMVLSIGELTSMAPTSGGHFYWSYILAPDWCRASLSYFVGWTQVIFWQANTCAGIFLTAGILQGTVVLQHDDYTPTRWQTTLIMYAIILLVCMANTFLLKAIPITETITLVLHIALWFGVLIPVVYFAPVKANAADVFANFTQGGGYQSAGATFFVGLLTTVYAFLGTDGVCHMVEEIPQPSIKVPWIMVTCVAVNGVLGLGMILGVLYCIGDVQAALSSPTGYPYLEIFQQALQSTTGAATMSGLILIILFMCVFSGFTASSRMLWAFARDGAVPLSKWIGRVHPQLQVPVYAIGMTATISTLLGLINVGSSVALNAFVSLSTAGSLACYIIVIGLILWRRLLRPHTIKWGPWRLGRWGVAANCFALVYSGIAFIFSFFPQTVPVTPETMNWSSLMFGGILIFAAIFWFFDGKRRYQGPIVETTVAERVA